MVNVITSCKRHLFAFYIKKSTKKNAIDPAKKGLFDFPLKEKKALLMVNMAR